MKKICFLGLFLLSYVVFASEQYPDLLVYNGQIYEIGDYPMETYFRIYPNRRPGTQGINSALLRGYRAKYEIINNELILMNIETMRNNGNWRIVDNRNYLNRIKVSTFSGRINLFNGRITGVFIGFTPIYENYIILEFENGNFIREYEESCYEYLQSIIQLYPNGSYEQNYFIGLLEQLNNMR